MSFDPDEVIIDGLTASAQLVNDLTLAKTAGALYRQVAAPFRATLSPGDTCSIAVPGMIIRPDIRGECLLAVFGDRAIVAWNKGLFRKTAQQSTLRLDAITDASWNVSTKAPTVGATILLVRTASDSWTIALPRDQPRLANAVRDALLSRSSI